VLTVGVFGFCVRVVTKNIAPCEVIFAVKEAENLLMRHGCLCGGELRLFAPCRLSETLRCVVSFRFNGRAFALFT